MRDYLEPMLGTNGALIAQFAITLVVLAVIILIVFWLIRTFTRGAGTAQIRGRQPRLSVLDALPVDQRRRLVLIRRDNVEHLILIGGPTDLVVEASIHRPSAAQRRAEAAARGPGQAPRFQQAVTANERIPFEEARAEEPLPPEPPLPEPDVQEPARPERLSRQEIARQELARQELARQEIVRQEPSRQEPSRHELSRQEPSRYEPSLEEAPADEPPAPLPVEAIDIEPEPQAEPPPVIHAPPPRPARPISSFLGSVGRSRSAPAETATEAPAEPRRPEPPPRPLGRTTPLAPRAPEPPVIDEVVEVAPPRVEPVRPAPRAPMPPAPPVAPPSLGDEPYGAPTADADRQIRFEPIFDIDPTDATDPGRPTRLSREPAPSVEPPRPADQPVEGELDASGDGDPRTRAAAVGDLEKEMARLLGEISGTRRN